VRVDANGGWSVDAAVDAIGVLDRAAGGLEYVEQPCATVEELARVRRRVEVPIAADESARSAADVLRLGDVAAGAGAHGVVCSGHEAAAVRDRHAGRLATLVPGVRLAGDGAGDQRRVVTPAAAAAAGARYVVLGRTVTGAADPAAALMRAKGELALASRA